MSRVIETLREEELDVARSRPRSGRRKAPADGNAAAPLVGCRHGHRKRALTGTFGRTEIAVQEHEEHKARAWIVLASSRLPRSAGKGPRRR